MVTKNYLLSYQCENNGGSDGSDSSAVTVVTKKNYLKTFFFIK